jgi:hypothetical protein
MASSANIPTFTDLYQHALTDRQWLGPFLSGHLMVEFMLRRLVSQYDQKLTPLAERMRHLELIELNYQIGTIRDDQRSVLISINQMRNRLAHQITFSPSINDMKALWQEAAGAFSDLTDGISQGLAEMDVEGNLDTLDSCVFSELFVQIAYDLHHAFTEMGGDEETF